MPEFLLQVVPVLAMLLIGYSIGGFAERRHLKRLAAREKELEVINVTDLRTFPSGSAPHPLGLVDGEVVVASDYFKTFVANLKKLIGGELKTYESLLGRARREALIRMKDAARRMGANHVVNVRFETSNIGMARRRRMAAMVELYAYGTAVYVPQSPAS
ncbi:MAG: YbjQ family protein [Phycisphaerae bacterium]|jgi:uncharacterized protein YbjQ (UPF0145 family)